MLPSIDNVVIAILNGQFALAQQKSIRHSMAGLCQPELADLHIFPRDHWTAIQEVRALRARGQVQYVALSSSPDVLPGVVHYVVPRIDQKAAPSFSTGH